jgi:hypothetical protein
MLRVLLWERLRFAHKTVQPVRPISNFFASGLSGVIFLFSEKTPAIVIERIVLQLITVEFRNKGCLL